MLRARVCNLCLSNEHRYKQTEEENNRTELFRGSSTSVFHLQPLFLVLSAPTSYTHCIRKCERDNLLVKAAVACE